MANEILISIGVILGLVFVLLLIMYIVYRILIRRGNIKFQALLGKVHEQNHVRKSKK